MLARRVLPPVVQLKRKPFENLLLTCRKQTDALAPLRTRRLTRGCRPSLRSSVNQQGWRVERNCSPRRNFYEYSYEYLTSVRFPGRKSRMRVLDLFWYRVLCCLLVACLGITERIPRHARIAIHAADIDIWQEV